MDVLTILSPWSTLGLMILVYLFLRVEQQTPEDAAVVGLRLFEYQEHPPSFLNILAWKWGTRTLAGRKKNDH